MREIKFRVFDTESCKMITPPTVSIGFGSGSEVIMMDLEGEISLLNAFNLPDGRNQMDVIKDRFEVMQYTGLKDMNGKEYYDRDIRVAPGQNNTYLQVVEWDAGTVSKIRCGWIARNMAIISTSEWQSKKKVVVEKSLNKMSYFSMPSAGEIVGNTHEPPEILNKQ